MFQLSLATSKKFLVAFEKSWWFQILKMFIQGHFVDVRERAMSLLGANYLRCNGTTSKCVNFYYRRGRSTSSYLRCRLIVNVKNEIFIAYVMKLPKNMNQVS
jgi:hypothetical protein